MLMTQRYQVEGGAKTWGLQAMKDNDTETPSVAAQRMIAAGAKHFGKTNVPVALADSQSYNPIYGTTNNPWDVTRTPGGSSGGSAAALAAGLTGIDAGPDLGSSIRNPAHYCRIFVPKPTHDCLTFRAHA